MSQDINKHLVSNFVHYAIFRAMTLGLSFTSLMSLCQTFVDIDKGEIGSSMQNAVATPVLCVLAGMASIQIQEPITDEQSLDWAIEDIRAGFEVGGDDYPPSIQAEAVRCMENWLGVTRSRGMEALAEALAGFPVSGGDFTVWNDGSRSNQK